jgi:hypothetical protein
VVRVGTRLGVLGAWLGLLALVDPLAKILPFPKEVVEIAIPRTQIAVAVIGGIVGWLACRGLKPPNRGAKLRSSS